MVTRRVTYRLYPSRHQEAQLHQWRRMHCALYNAALADRKMSYQKLGVSVGYFDQQNRLPEFKQVWPEYVELGSHALQATLKRVDFAYSRFFKGLGGYPKFKASRRFSGWTYPCKAGWKAQTNGTHGQLSLTNLGIVRMRGQARTWGTPTTCTILHRHGKWYASITVQCEPVRATGDAAVGIDLGCKEAVTLSTGEQIHKPEFIADGDKAVKRASKKLRRKRAPNRVKRVKASRRWRKYQSVKSKLQRQVTRQRENWLHQITSDIVSGNSLIAGEQLNVQGMTRKAKKGSKRKAQKAGLNRSILSVGFGMIGGMLGYKSAEAGGFYVESPTRQLKPSQRCVKCWELTPKTLRDRVHVCSNPQCGHVEDRDVNAAQVNLIWARGQVSVSGRRSRQAHVLASLVVESASSTACGSMRQLAAKKRQKPCAS